MAENVQRTAGIPGAYKLDRGNAPTQVGIYIGEVRAVVDSKVRGGRLQVWIEDFAGPDKTNPDLWRTVSPVSPFYGTTSPSTEQDTGEGSYIGNKQSYGMWFTPPDIGTQVVCVFASGDANYGYYLGCVVEPGLNHMLPAIGATNKFKLDNNAQSPYFQSSPRLPVVEINDANTAISENPRFFDQTKPVHSVVAATLLQQGLINDPLRGPIGSNAQRESPSAVYGISTPGRPIYAGGLSEQNIRQQLEQGLLLPQDVKVIGRRGGHSIVMDDGDLTGQDALVRIRTAKGHQITMSDTGDCFFITHANGQTWLEFGSQGTVDIYSTNSINLRSQGDINIHADRNINMNARGSINMRGERSVTAESESVIQLNSKKAVLMYGDSFVGIKSDGSLSLKSSKSGTWDAGSNMVLSAGCISLNGGSAPDVPKPTNMPIQNLPDVKFEQNRGWVVEGGAIKTAVTRAPTHMPYPFANRGVQAQTSIDTFDNVGAPLPVDIEERYVEIQDTEFEAIGEQDYEEQEPATVSVGSIEPEQVTGMLAQASKDVPQDAIEISNEYGVGKYGFDPEQLEAAGYLKPGTYEFYLADSETDVTDILNNPTVWTGYAGVNNAADLLNDPKLQDDIQADLLQKSLVDLRDQGIVTGTEDPAKLAGLVQAGAKYGAPTVKGWINGTVGDATLVSNINKLVRGGQYAVELVNQKISQAVQGFSTTSPSATGTTVRTAVDAALNAVIGNSKIPTPVFSSTFNLYANVSDADLTYSGNDEVVRARINEERARRGLPPIAAA
jgi:hypothetical protein